MAKWEYCIDNWEDLVTSDNLLNSYGKSGWELIAICDGLGVFKRPVLVKYEIGVDMAADTYSESVEVLAIRRAND